MRYFSKSLFFASNIIFRYDVIDVGRKNLVGHVFILADLVNPFQIVAHGAWFSASLNLSLMVYYSPIKIDYASVETQIAGRMPPIEVSGATAFIFSSAPVWTPKRSYEFSPIVHQ